MSNFPVISQHALLTLCTQFKLGELVQTHTMKGALSPSSYSSLLDSDLRPGGPYPHPHDSSDHEDDNWWDSRPASWHGSSIRQDHAGANVLGPWEAAWRAPEAVIERLPLAQISESFPESSKGKCVHYFAIALQLL